MNMSGSCVLAKDEVVGVIINEGYVYVPASGSRRLWWISTVQYLVDF